MNEPYTEILLCFPIFTVEVFLIMMITRTQEKMQQGCSFKCVLQKIKNIFNHTIFQKNRLKGFLIIVIGVTAGGIMRYMATDIKSINPTFNDWIFEGMTQMSYIFSAAVAAIYINHGYGLEQPCKKLVERPMNKVKRPKNKVK